MVHYLRAQPLSGHWLCFSLQVHKYLLDHPRVFDTSDYLDSATASFADCNIDMEYTLEYTAKAIKCGSATEEQQPRPQLRCTPITTHPYGIWYFGKSGHLDIAHGHRCLYGYLRDNPITLVMMTDK